MVEQCQSGFIFDQQNGCVPGNSDSCKKEIVSLPELDKINSQLNLDEICAGNELGFVPNPGSCTTFIVCVFQEGMLESCPNRAPIFDPNRLICVAGK